MTPETTARLLALPSLRRQAEQDARESLSFALRDSPDGDLPWTLWDNVTAHNRQRAVDHHARLLADITRWQSQAWALRRIGALVWREEPDYAPALNQAELELERGKYTVCWVLGGKCYGHPLWNDSHIPGIGRMSRPEVLAAILLHVEEA